MANLRKTAFGKLLIVCVGDMGPRGQRQGVPARQVAGWSRCYRSPPARPAGFRASLRIDRGRRVLICPENLSRFFHRKMSYRLRGQLSCALSGIPEGGGTSESGAPVPGDQTAARLYEVTLTGIGKKHRSGTDLVCVVEPMDGAPAFVGDGMKTMVWMEMP